MNLGFRANLKELLQQVDLGKKLKGLKTFHVATEKTEVKIEDKWYPLSTNKDDMALLPIKLFVGCIHPKRIVSVSGETREDKVQIAAIPFSVVKDEKSMQVAISLISKMEAWENNKAELQEIFEKSRYLRFLGISYILNTWDKNKNFLNSVFRRECQLLLFTWQLPLNDQPLLETLVTLKKMLGLLGKNLLYEPVEGWTPWLHLYPLKPSININGEILEDKTRNSTTETRALFLLEHGADPNSQHPYCGTMLHIMAANECSPQEITHLIQLVGRASKIKLLFNIKDGEGKTPLLIFVKTRNVAAAKYLCELKKKGMDIDVNIPDDQGRTPLMFALATGCLELVNVLNAAGASWQAKDKQGKSTFDYANTSEEMLVKLFGEIHIDADRSSLSTQSHVKNSSGATFYVSEDKKNWSKVLISSANLLQILRLIKSVPENERLLILFQVKNVIEQDSKSLLQICMEGRPTVMALAAQRKSKLDDLLKLMETKKSAKEQADTSFKDMKESKNAVQQPPMPTMTSAQPFMGLAQKKESKAEVPLKTSSRTPKHAPKTVSYCGAFWSRPEVLVGAAVITFIGAAVVKTMMP